MSKPDHTAAVALLRDMEPWDVSDICELDLTFAPDDTAGRRIGAYLRDAVISTYEKGAAALASVHEIGTVLGLSTAEQYAAVGAAQDMRLEEVPGWPGVAVGLRTADDLLVAVLSEVYRRAVRALVEHAEQETAPETGAQD